MIDIYYHFYSGTKPAGVTALHVSTSAPWHWGRIPTTGARIGRTLRGMSPRPTEHRARIEAEPPTRCSTRTRVLSRLVAPGLVVRAVQDPSSRGAALVPSGREHRLMLVANGAMRLEKRELGGGRWRATTLAPGDLHIASAGSDGYEISWIRRSDRPLDLIHVDLDPALLARACAADGAELSERDIPGRVGVRDPLLEQLVLRLGRVVRDARECDDGYARRIADLLAWHLLREHGAPPVAARQPRGGLSAARLRRVQDLVAARLAQPLAVADLAREAGLSAYHFARAFKSATGQTPHRYLLHRRIEEARRLLRDTRMPIGQIAAAVGFPSQAHLTTRFRLATGVTPARFRQG